MAKKKAEDKEIEQTEEKVVEVSEPKFSPQKVSDNRIKFATWFPLAVKSHKAVRVHHMSGIKAFFESTGIGLMNTPEAYEKGLRKYGYKL